MDSDVEVESLRNKMNELLEREKILWKQQSQVPCRDDIKLIMMGYFLDIITSAGDVDMQDVLDVMEPQISSRDNEFLMAEF